LGAESDTCSNTQCPHYQRCFFFKARRHAEDAQILVVNHHLLFADLSLRLETENYTSSAVLPYYSHVIIDEAHHIEDVATDFFGEKISKLSLLRTLKRLASENVQKASGKLPLLREKLSQCFPGAPPADVSSIFLRLNIDLPAMRNDLVKRIQDTFQALTDFADLQNRNQEDNTSKESKLRLYAEQFDQPLWQKEVIPSAKSLISACRNYVQSIYNIEADLKELNHDRFQEQSKSIRLDIIAFADRLANQSLLVENLILKIPTSEKVRWIELSPLKSGINTSVASAYLDISSLMAKALFSKFQAVILCSATLSTNHQFDYVRKRLGMTEEALPNKKLVERIYDSPFNYAKQALLIVPKDLPPPQNVNFIAAATEQIWNAIVASRGSTFVLFTSYGMMQKCHELLAERLQNGRFNLYKQGDTNRQKLLNQFKTTPRSVLFGTDSFWEGVDVSGEALRCVIIVKLPFRVPTEPIIQARTEAIIAQGGDAFTEYSLPNAIVKFKQGFGRLIRHNNDRGCIICLDTRLITKGYGKIFLDSLPNCQKSLPLSAEVEEQMRTFYRRTHHLIIQ
ncbi:MAG: ATP-dependent DNA helicase DinG, partial [Parachlamydiaceae bacterium]|nr:ATP-dependent DNA helicase DinG [Parachlamydiaceae bacterium]